MTKESGKRNGKLYIMRHGKTDWNALHKLQGRTDIALNEEGRAMAEEARRKYSSVNIDVCYSSPLIRAVETAEIFLRGRGVPVFTDERLVEMGFGEYEGIENSFQIPDCPINMIFMEPENYTESIGGAETFSELFERTGEFLRQVIEPELKEGKDILIVGHGAMNASIIQQLRGLPIEEFWSCGLEQCKLLTV